MRRVKVKVDGADGGQGGDVSRGDESGGRGRTAATRPGLDGLAMAWRLTFCFNSDLTTIPVARRLVAYIARMEGGSEEVAQSVEVAVGEVLANAYHHAYKGGVGPLVLELSCDGARLQILVHDDGAPVVDKPAIPRVLPRGVGGRGLYIVGQLMDEAEVIHPRGESGGTAVRLTKDLSRNSGRDAKNPRGAAF
jgi:anti-sigma regulatory factor (Ser/Thr protein kinase)